MPRPRFKSFPRYFSFATNAGSRGRTIIKRALCTPRDRPIIHRTYIPRRTVRFRLFPSSLCLHTKHRPNCLFEKTITVSCFPCVRQTRSEQIRRPLRRGPSRMHVLHEAAAHSNPPWRSSILFTRAEKHSFSFCLSVVHLADGVTTERQSTSTDTAPVFFSPMVFSFPRRPAAFFPVSFSLSRRLTEHDVRLQPEGSCIKSMFSTLAGRHAEFSLLG